MVRTTTTNTRVVHVHIPGDFEGEIHLHVEPAGVRLPPPDSGITISQVSAVEEILDRFERRTHSESARVVCQTLVAQGWEARAPLRRSANVNTAPYIRLIYKGSHHRISMFLNSQSLQSVQQRADKLAELVDGALMRAGRMYVYHWKGRTEIATQAMTVLQRWADGELPEAEGN